MASIRIKGAAGHIIVEGSNYDYDSVSIEEGQDDADRLYYWLMTHVSFERTMKPLVFRLLDWSGDAWLKEYQDRAERRMRE